MGDNLVEILDFYIIAPHIIYKDILIEKNTLVNTFIS